MARGTSLKTKLAACLCVILEIPHRHQQLMSEDQVLSLAAFDHYPIRHVDGGPFAHWNLMPRTIMAHREKTATIDIPQIRKADRLRKAFDVPLSPSIGAAMDRLAQQVDPRIFKELGRPWPTGRKLESRNTLRRNKPKRRKR